MKLHSSHSVVSGLAGVAGFAAGALLVGILALEHPHTSKAAESPRTLVSRAAAQDAPGIEPIRFRECLGRAGVEAGMAGAAVIGLRRVRLEVERAVDLA